MCGVTDVTILLQLRKDMRSGFATPGLLDPRLPARFVASVALVIVFSHSSPTTIEAQRRQTQRRRAVKPTEKSVRDFSVFKHEDHRLPKTKADCSQCHTITSI